MNLRDTLRAQSLDHKATTAIQVSKVTDSLIAGLVTSMQDAASREGKTSFSTYLTDSAQYLRLNGQCQDAGKTALIRRFQLEGLVVHSTCDDLLTISWD